MPLSVPGVARMRQHAAAVAPARLPRAALGLCTSAATGTLGMLALAAMAGIYTGTRSSSPGPDGVVVVGSLMGLAVACPIDPNKSCRSVLRPTRLVGTQIVHMAGPY